MVPIMSVVTFGTSYVGKVDRVPGQFYLVTKVFQVVSIPLIPLGSFIVQEGTEVESFVGGLQSFKGSQTDLCLKSYFWAWLRALWFVVGLLASIGVLPLLLGYDELPGFLYLGGMVAGMVSLAFWFRSRQGLLATQPRALELANQIQVPRRRPS